MFHIHYSRFFQNYCNFFSIFSFVCTKWLMKFIDLRTYLIKILSVFLILFCLLKWGFSGLKQSSGSQIQSRNTIWISLASAAFSFLMPEFYEHLLWYWCCLQTNLEIYMSFSLDRLVTKNQRLNDSQIICCCSFSKWEEDSLACSLFEKKP